MFVRRIFKGDVQAGMAAIVAFSILFGSTPAIARDDLWQYDGQSGNGVVSWTEQGIDFPSFFAPNNRQCVAASGTCDTAHAKVGHGFVDYSLCVDNAELYCIESIQISKNGKDITTKFADEVDWEKIDVPLEHGVIRGGAPTIWKTEDGGVEQLYAVKAFSGFSWNEGPAHADKLEMVITPVRTGYGRCSLRVKQDCYLQQNFEEGERASIAMRLPANLGGFFMGRIGDASVEQSVTKNGYSRVVKLSAEPVDVPRVAVQIGSTETRLNRLCNFGTICSLPAYDGGALGVGGWEPAWRVTEDNARETSQARGRVWRVYAISPGSTDYAGCTTKSPGFLGVGSTNALLYDYNPPKYTGSDFIFKVGGLHFKMDSSLELGIYQVKISSTFARCLYGFTNAPISASISVVDDGGKKSNAITTIGESGGWINISATGFTFSSPTISVKLSQAKAPAKKTTINCVKGKLSKKVTEVGPKCPAGYKKK